MNRARLLLSVAVMRLGVTAAPASADQARDTVARSEVTVDRYEEEDHDGVILSGMRVQHRWEKERAGTLWTVSVGGQAWREINDEALFRERLRERLGPMVDAELRQSELGLYFENEARVGTWLSLAGGLRIERRLDFELTAQVEILPWLRVDLELALADRSTRLGLVGAWQWRSLDLELSLENVLGLQASARYSF